MKKVLPKRPREGDYVIELILIPIVFKVVNVISSLGEGAYVTELDLILSAQKFTFSQIPVLMPQSWI